MIGVVNQEGLVCVGSKENNNKRVKNRVSEDIVRLTLVLVDIPIV